MRTIHRRALLWAATVLSCGAAAGLTSLTASAQTPATTPNYPSRPVTLVVPFAAGGATDTLARVMGRALEKYTGQPFVVENAGGAGATLGTAKVAAANPDGYTLLLGGSSALVMAPHLYSKLKYDPFTSFEPIAKIAYAPYVLVTKGGSELTTFDQWRTFAHNHPGTMNFGSPGEGSALHLTIELLKSQAQVDALHIPFRGSSFAWNALLAGDVDFIIDTPSAALPMVRSGKANALAVTSSERLPDLPTTPTLDELGLKDFESLAWFALLAPQGTPEHAVARLNTAVDQAMRDPEVLEMLSKNQFSPATQVPGGLAGEIRREYDKWGEVIKSKNMQLE